MSVVIGWRGDERGLERAVRSLRDVSAQPPGEVIVAVPEGATVPERAGRRARCRRRGTVQPLAGRQPRRRGGRRRLAAVLLRRGRGRRARLARAACCCTPRLPGVVAVGPLLARPDGRTEAAGVAVGLDRAGAADARRARRRRRRLLRLAGLLPRRLGAVAPTACCVERRGLRARRRLRRELRHRLRGLRPLPAPARRSAAGSSTRRARGSSSTSRRPRGASRVDIVDRALFVDRWYDAARARRSLLQPRLRSATARRSRSA